MAEIKTHKLRLPPAMSKGARQRRADKLTAKLAEKGFKTIRYTDGGFFGNSYLYVEGEGNGPIDLWGIVERFFTALVLAAAAYYFYTHFINKGG